jgi:S-adenosylmethionine:tRNA ribosyltransferase-isomerase
LNTSLFDYQLPADRIAQEARLRGSSRLLVLDRARGTVQHRTFADFPSLLDAGDVLVRNDVRVRHARLWGRDDGGRLVELLLLAPLDDGRRWTALAKPGRRARKGRDLKFQDGTTATISDVHPDGRREALFDRVVDDAFLERQGAIPLPPYIRRAAGSEDRPEDREAYQTIFAS